MYSLEYRIIVIIVVSCWYVVHAGYIDILVSCSWLYIDSDFANLHLIWFQVLIVNC